VLSPTFTASRSQRSPNRKPTPRKPPAQTPPTVSRQRVYHAAMNRPPTTFTIRTAEPADADHITRLMKSEPGFWNDRWPEAIVAHTLAAPTTIAIVATLAPHHPSQLPSPTGRGAGVEGAPTPLPAPRQATTPPAHPTEHQAELAAFACAHNLGFRGYLSELIVAANHRSQGIASALLAAIEERLANQGCPLVITDAWRDAEAFYRRKGWSPPEAILLRKRL
jgi:GNAT superfamily N-acetyltransferase